ncbi:TRM11 family SAM-dependent methyltransferase [Dactylosporangium sp. CA-233914]|uniref:TRM11 family SAM-dependent methyltransferase n=1 Tax=Dactylosporangium sp. CA-233914 TaxID=3239934 RepID=UPI003D8DB33C
MALYALLILPSANRVYADASVELTRAELVAFDRGVLGGRLAEVGTRVVGGVSYVTFEADSLSAGDVAVLGNLSSVYALFEVVGELLRPVEVARLDRFDDDLITIQKYQGKTNEQFTKLLLNVTLLASEFAPQMLQRRFRVLDPLCGRGTTLNQALMYGFDAAGVDRDQKDFEAYATFIQTWLKRKRIKHKAEFGPVRRERQVVAKRLRIELAADRDDYKSGAVQLLDVVNADTVRAREFFKDGTFDLIVTDAPYGVQHGSRTAGKGLVRSPEDLLAEAAPVWARLLRPGGAMGVAWNTFVAKRELAAGLLAAAGLEVVQDEPYQSFKHRVDQAILRDVLVARKH